LQSAIIYFLFYPQISLSLHAITDDNVSYATLALKLNLAAVVVVVVGAIVVVVEVVVVVVETNVLPLTTFE
jgi:hypothetical protein